MPVNNKKPATRQQANDVDQCRSDQCTCTGTANIVEELKARIDELSDIVTKQDAVIDKLSTRMGFVLSYLDIQNDSPKTPEPDSVYIADSFEPSTASDRITLRPGTAAAVPKTFQAKSCRDDMLTAIYMEQNEKTWRAKQFMVSGLPDNSDGDNDRNQIIALCQDELNIKPDVVATERVGPVQNRKPRLLKVSLKSHEQVHTIVHAARQLRRSSSDYVKQNIYINPNRTKAEARAAFELREKRRLAKRRWIERQQDRNQPPSDLNPDAAEFNASATPTNSGPVSHQRAVGQILLASRPSQNADENRGADDDVNSDDVQSDKDLQC